jgi:hypothetical protein
MNKIILYSVPIHFRSFSRIDLRDVNGIPLLEFDAFVLYLCHSVKKYTELLKSNVKIYYEYDVAGQDEQMAFAEIKHRMKYSSCFSVLNVGGHLYYTVKDIHTGLDTAIRTQFIQELKKWEDKTPDNLDYILCCSRFEESATAIIQS